MLTKKVNFTHQEELDGQDTRDIKAIIEGVGADAEVVTNAQGGKQSKSPAALHLVDPKFMGKIFREYELLSDKPSIAKAGKLICLYMSSLDEDKLYSSLEYFSCDMLTTLLTIGKVLQYGATKSNNGQGYPVNNWRLISREEHLNHALIHLVALLAGDTQDDHKEHAMCRIHMAIATEETPGFSYTEPFKDELQQTA